MITKFDAVLSLVGYKRFREDVNKDIIWEDDESLKPTEEQIDAELERLTNDEPYAILRRKRNLILKGSDWMVLPDKNPTQAQLDYRQALRDLPANSPNASLDQNGNLINVNWPEKPE